MMRVQLPPAEGNVTCGSLYFILTVNSFLSAAEIDVSSWVLRSRIEADASGSAVDGTNTVQNPFHKLDHATLTVPGGATSTADSEYFANWDSLGNFNFLVNGQHTDAGHNTLFSRSTGSIIFAPHVNSIISVDLEYNYALGNGLRQAFASFHVGETGPGHSAILLYSERRLTILGQMVGQMNYEPADIILEAGHSYTLGYRLELESLGGSPTVLSSGNGSVDIRISPIPEPASLTLLTLGSLLALRRQRPNRT